MLQNSRVTAFIISELREKQQGSGEGKWVKYSSPLSTQIRVNICHTVILTETVSQEINTP